jgi:DNA-directed RNA polymerase subunit RPC12/RpoP
MPYHERNAFRDRANEKRRTENYDKTYRPFLNAFDDDLPRRRTKDMSYTHRCINCGKRVKSDHIALPPGWVNSKSGVVCDECSDGYEPLEKTTESL